jgi:hypothetical protein
MLAYTVQVSPSPPPSLVLTEVARGEMSIWTSSAWLAIANSATNFGTLFGLNPPPSLLLTLSQFRRHLLD